MKSFLLLMGFFVSIEASANSASSSLGYKRSSYKSSRSTTSGSSYSAQRAANGYKQAYTSAVVSTGSQVYTPQPTPTTPIVVDTPQIAANPSACLAMIQAERGRIYVESGNNQLPTIGFCTKIEVGFDLNYNGVNEEVDFCNNVTSYRPCTQNDGGYFLFQNECVARNGVWVRSIDNNRNSPLFGQESGSCLTQQAHACGNVQAGYAGQLVSSSGNSISATPAGNVGCWNRSEVYDFQRNPQANITEFLYEMIRFNNNSEAQAIEGYVAALSNASTADDAAAISALGSLRTAAVACITAGKTGGYYLINCLVETDRAAIDDYDSRFRNSACIDYIPASQRAVNADPHLQCPGGN